MRLLVFGHCAPERMFALDDPDAISETTFEAAVVRALSCFYPQYRVIVFPGTFRLDGSAHVPDLALVALDFSHWFVVEVELASHSLEGHVLPQVRAFRYGVPQEDCVMALSRGLEIAPERAATLVRTVPRSVAVVANRSNPMWDIALRALDTQLLIVSTFRTQGGVEAYEMNGRLEILSESLGFGTYSALDRSLRVPRVMRVPLGRIQISTESGVSWWVVAEAAAALWITKESGIPDIHDGAYVQVIRTIRGHISFRVTR